MNNLAKLEIVMPGKVAQKLDALLVFDGHMTDSGTRRQLLQILPSFIRLRYAWRAHYRKYGCLACPKPDPTIAIAARLRLRRFAWAEIYKIVGIDRAATTRIERKHFEQHVRWRLAHLDEPGRIGNQKHERCHLAGGFCDKCYARLSRRLSETLRTMHEGRDAKEETAGLTRKFDVARFLLNGGDE
jgi:hypothetical protein